MGKLHPSVVCILVVLGCLIFSVFVPTGLDILRELMIAAVSGYFGFLRGSDQ